MKAIQIFTAENGKRSPRLSRSTPSHLIILDVMMPVMDGIETCERLRMDKRFQNTIIMFLSARGEDYSHVVAFESGADDYVTKPIKPRILNSKVKAMLRRFLKDDVGGNIVIGDMEINVEEYKVNHQGKEIILPRKEFEKIALSLGFQTKEGIQAFKNHGVGLGKRCHRWRSHH